MQDIGRILLVVGVIMLVLGAAFYFGGKLGIGRLPGDFVVRRGNFTFYFPLASSIVISIVLSLVFWALRR